MVTSEKKKIVVREEERKYLELNNLTLEQCSEQDLENIRFNVAFALGKLVRDG